MKTLKCWLVGGMLATTCLAASVCAQENSKALSTQSAVTQTELAATDLGAARYLAANCANCHGTNGQSSGAIPSLAGQSKADLIEQMRKFRQDQRAATLMHQIAKGYSEQQVELIADYFSRQRAAR